MIESLLAIVIVLVILLAFIWFMNVEYQWYLNRFRMSPGDWRRLFILSSTTNDAWMQTYEYSLWKWATLTS